VEQDRLVRGIRGGAVEHVAGVRLREIAVLAVEVGTDRLRELLEIGGPAGVESPEERRSVAPQLLLDHVAVGGRPVGQVHVSRARLECDRKIQAGGGRTDPDQLAFEKVDRPGLDLLELLQT
jgi:hypothetical protein